MTVLFGTGLPEIFAELPAKAKQQASQSIDLLSSNPRMYPIRRRGLMIAGREVRMTAIIPAAMRRA